MGWVYLLSIGGSKVAYCLFKLIFIIIYFINSFISIIKLGWNNVWLSKVWFTL